MFKIVALNLLVLLTFINGSLAKVAPSYIQICPGLKSDCLKRVIQETLPEFAKGIPELGIASIDPLKEDHVDVILPGGFKVVLQNGTLNGLKKCHIDSVSYKNDEAELKAHCNLTIKGQYKANGRILIVAINGDGDAKIKIKNASLVAKIKFVDKVRDGVVYHEVKDLSIKQDYGDKVVFILTNLFQGNPQLSEAVLAFLNQNWKQVAEEFGQPLVDWLVGIVSKIITKFFETVPKDELFVYN